MMRAHAHELVALIGARGYGRVSSLQIATGRPRAGETFTPRANLNPQRKPARLGSKARAALELLEATGSELATSAIAASTGQDRQDALKTLQRLRDSGLVTSRTEFARVPASTRCGWRTSPVSYWAIKQGGPE